MPASHLFPDAWERFCAPIPPEERHDMIGAYHRRLTDPEGMLPRGQAVYRPCSLSSTEEYPAGFEPLPGYDPPARTVPFGGTGTPGHLVGETFRLSLGLDAKQDRLLTRLLARSPRVVREPEIGWDDLWTGDTNGADGPEFSILRGNNVHESVPFWAVLVPMSHEHLPPVRHQPADRPVQPKPLGEYRQLPPLRPDGELRPVLLEPEHPRVRPVHARLRDQQ